MRSLAKGQILAAVRKPPLDYRGVGSSQINRPASPGKELHSAEQAAGQTGGRDMSTRIVCPACGAHLKAEKLLAPGTAIGCPKCGGRFHLTAGEPHDPAGAETVAPKAIDENRARLDDPQPPAQAAVDRHGVIVISRKTLLIASVMLFLGIAIAVPITYFAVRQPTIANSGPDDPPKPPPAPPPGGGPEEKPGKPPSTPPAEEPARTAPVAEGEPAPLF